MKVEETEKKSILVIGGGIAGITAAIEAAETGFSVHLVEREAFLGGRVLWLDRYFPKLCPPTCGLEFHFRRMATHPRIQAYTLAEVTHIRRKERGFEVELLLRPRYVNERCTACGKCREVCKTEIPNPFNYGMDTMKAAYLPHEMAFPFRYVLAPEIVGTEEGEKCREACPYGAIDLDMRTHVLLLHVSSIIVATGWVPYPAEKIDLLGYGVSPHVITNVMMERLSASNGPSGGRILRPADGRRPKIVAFCQCAGQRDESHLPFCSRVCCLASVKQALIIREQLPECQVTIFYIDLRALGRSEDLLAKIQADRAIHLIRGKIARVTEDPQNRGLILEAERTDSGRIYRMLADLLVLATGMQPSPSSKEDSGIAGNSDENGFFLDSPGIFATGCAKAPMDVAAVVQDATGAVLKAIQYMMRKEFG